jgi:hypothetical protein
MMLVVLAIFAFRLIAENFPVFEKDASTAIMPGPVRTDQNR